MLNATTALLVAHALVAAAPVARPRPAVPPVIEVLYAGALQSGWMDYGWSPRELDRGRARLDLTNYGGWILGKPGGRSDAGGVSFSISAAHAKKLEVRLEGQGQFPRLALDAFEPVSEANGLRRYFLPMSALNPGRVTFDQLVFQGLERGPLRDVTIDDVAFTAEPNGTRPVATSLTEVKVKVECSEKASPISPYIYGVAFDSGRPDDDTPFALGATARRWGGNASSRYNWRIHAWNAGSDWYFRNVEYTGIANYSYDTFLEQQRNRGLKVALTVPMLGWVARDRVSASFPVVLFPRQAQLDPYDSAHGNGVGSDGSPLTPGPPQLTSVSAPPDSMREWVETIRGKDQRTGRGRSVHLYYLDNEPNLWSSTHRDVHPQPLTYDELWARTVAYAKAIRQADPEAVIAGPCEWGWSAYFYSAADLKAGGTVLRPDRRRHEDLPLIAWYLKKAAEHQKKTGERVLDVLDLHFYPQGREVGIGTGGKLDASTSALRVRSPRALWDPGYRDESWIGEPVRLLPRMHDWIDAYDPGLGLSIGEYNFGAEQHPSGGLAQAQALGLFGQHGVTWAFDWYYPPKGSAAAQAFLAYRNYDGRGGRFLDLSAPAKSSQPFVTAYASRDERGAKLVVVVLNLDPSKAAAAAVEAPSCGSVTASRVFQTTFGPRGLEQAAAARPERVELPPYSLSVVELQLAPRR